MTFYVTPVTSLVSPEPKLSLLLYYLDFWINLGIENTKY